MAVVLLPKGAANDVKINLINMLGVGVYSLTSSQLYVQALLVLVLDGNDVI